MTMEDKHEGWRQAGWEKKHVWVSPAHVFCRVGKSEVESCSKGLQGQNKQPAWSSVLLQKILLSLKFPASRGGGGCRGNRVWDGVKIARAAREGETSYRSVKPLRWNCACLGLQRADDSSFGFFCRAHTTFALHNPSHCALFFSIIWGEISSMHFKS